MAAYAEFAASQTSFPENVHCLEALAVGEQTEEAEDWGRVIAQALARGQLEPWMRRALEDTRPLVISLAEDSEDSDEEDDEEDSDSDPPGPGGGREGSPQWHPCRQLSEYEEVEAYFLSPVGSNYYLADSLGGASTEDDAEDREKVVASLEKSSSVSPTEPNGLEYQTTRTNTDCGSSGKERSSGCSDSDSGDEASSYKSANDEELDLTDTSNESVEGGEGEAGGGGGEAELVRQVVARLIESSGLFGKGGRGGEGGFKEFVPRATPSPNPPPTPPKTKGEGGRFQPSEVDPWLKPYDPPPGRRGCPLLYPPPPPFLHLYRIKEDGYPSGGVSPAAKDPILSAVASQEYERSYELSDRDYYFLRGFPDSPPPPRLHPDLPRLNWVFPPFRISPEVMMKRSFYRCSSRKQLRHLTKY